MGGSVRLKVCGMREEKNLLEIIEAKPDYIGFIFHEPSPRYAGAVSIDTMGRIPEQICKTGVFVKAGIGEILQKVNKYQLDAVQLHGEQTKEFVAEIRSSLPEIQLIKVFGVDDDFSIKQTEDFVDKSDFFLFDTKTIDFGGSGKSFSRKGIEWEQLGRPYFISGGIGVDEVEYVLEELSEKGLYGIDINSRVELSYALKDPAKVKKVKEIIDRYGK